MDLTKIQTSVDFINTHHYDAIPVYIPKFGFFVPVPMEYIYRILDELSGRTPNDSFVPSPDLSEMLSVGAITDDTLSED